MNPFGKYAFALGVIFASTEVSADVVRVDGGVPYFNSTGRLVIDGVRVIGQASGLLDSFRLTYQLNKSTFDFSLVRKEKFQGVGIFSEWMFAKNITVQQPTFSYNGQTYSSGEFVTLDSNSVGVIEIVYRLQAGHAISYNFDALGADVRYRFYGPSHDETSFLPGNTYLITGAMAILRDGIYKFRLQSIDGQPFSARFKSFNGNNRRLVSLVTGSQIGDQFQYGVRDYSKYVINLRVGDILRLEAAPDNIQLHIISKYGGKLLDFTGIPVVFKANYTGRHYVFIRNQKGWGGSYSSSVSISRTDPRLEAEATVSEVDMISTAGHATAGN